MLERLYGDVLVLLCASHLTVHDMVRGLQATCRDLHRTMASSSFYWDVAVERKGVDFWIGALTRRTHRVFQGMCRELHHVEVFERKLRSHTLAVWTHAEYQAWWRAEALYDRCRSSACTPEMARAMDTPLALAMASRISCMQ